MIALKMYNLLTMGAFTYDVSKLPPQMIVSIVGSNAIYARFESEHRLWMPGGEITFTEQPKIKSQSQIYRYN